MHCYSPRWQCLFRQLLACSPGVDDCMWSFHPIIHLSPDPCITQMWHLSGVFVSLPVIVHLYRPASRRHMYVPLAPSLYRCL